MQTRPITHDDLASSVIATPPLARNEAGQVDAEENRRLIQHIEEGRIRHLLYGANANFYHLGVGEHREILAHLAETVGPQTIITPSVGASFGVMMEQAAAVREFEFPSSMILPMPMQELGDPHGFATVVRHYAEAVGHPVVVHIIEEGSIAPEALAAVFHDGLLSWVNYAVPRVNPKEDAYLKTLVDLVDPELFVSGFGEQVATTHMTRYGMGTFSTSVGCIAPALAQWMLEALRSGHFAKAEELRRVFEPLENLQEQFNPIRVIHDAITLGGVAKCGDPHPPLSSLESAVVEAVLNAAQDLLNAST